MVGGGRLPRLLPGAAREEVKVVLVLVVVVAEFPRGHPVGVGGWYALDRRDVAHELALVVQTRAEEHVRYLPVHPGVRDVQRLGERERHRGGEHVLDVRGAAEGTGIYAHPEVFQPGARLVDGGEHRDGVAVLGLEGELLERGRPSGLRHATHLVDEAHVVHRRLELPPQAFRPALGPRGAGHLRRGVGRGGGGLFVAAETRRLEIAVQAVLGSAGWGCLGGERRGLMDCGGLERGRLGDGRGRGRCGRELLARGLVGAGVNAGRGRHRRRGRHGRRCGISHASLCGAVSAEVAHFSNG